MRQMKVNPRRVDGKDLTVLDYQGRRITFKSGGTLVPRTTFYNRLLKDKDLLEVKDRETTPVPSKPVTTPTEKTSTKSSTKKSSNTSKSETDSK